MRYMLDTNICIYIIKKQLEEILYKFKSIEVGDLCLSSVTLSELTYSAEKSQYKQRNLSALKEFILPLSIVPFDEAAAFCYGQIRSTLEKKGTPIGSMDLMIAAHAQSLNSILVTNNEKEFVRVNRLKIENWIKMPETQST